MSMALTAQITSQQAREAGNRKLVRRWLYIELLVIFALVLVGGATRLTDSGLSITEWKPIHGVIPPLSEVEWQEEFAKYQQIPEYQTINKGMTIDAFKQIFWWEWAHRLLARATGFVFAIPLAFLLADRKAGADAEASVARHSGAGRFSGVHRLVDGVVGSDRADRCQPVPAGNASRHGQPDLCSDDLGCARFGRVFTATGSGWHPPLCRVSGSAGHGADLSGRTGGGLDAGLAYNTWPLMDGKLVPDGLMVMQPAWRNLFENALTVQFIHRLGAYLVWIIAVWHMAAALGSEPGTTHARRAVLLFVLVTVQAGLGIFALLTQVQLHAALAHQGMALIVLAFAAAHWRGTKGSYMPQTAIAVAH